ncbi:putative metallohydrolase [uncultured archaeon]|nr:putative metallohydrolase [uncultured archaeon]
MMDDFFKSLVSMDTNVNESKNYLECAVRIAREAEVLGLQAKIYHAKAPDGRTRPNVLLDLDMGAEKTLLIGAHYDVYPAGDGWKTYPFELVGKGGKAYGRGTGNKGSVAAALYAMTEVEPKVNVQLAFTCDARAGGWFGMGDLVKKKLIKADAALILEGAPELTSAASGLIAGKFRFSGRAGFAAMPFAADNPVPKLLAFMGELEKYSAVRSRSSSGYYSAEGKRICGRFSITTLAGGHKSDMIPREATAGFDLRLTPEEDTNRMLAEFKGVAKRAGLKTRARTKLDIEEISPGYMSSGPFVESMKAMTRTRGNYASWGRNDGHHVARMMPAVCFGPSRPQCNATAANEFVFLRDLDYVKEVTKKIVAQGW